MSHTIICKQCLQSVTIPPDQEEVDVHSAISCGCCTEDHHHGQAAAACGQDHPCAGCEADFANDGHDDNCKQGHTGPCWQGPQSGPKPDGCTVCRPLLIQAVAGARLGDRPA